MDDLLTQYRAQIEALQNELLKYKDIVAELYADMKTMQNILKNEK